ncbi:MAG: ABC transporter permease [Bacteroidaceae bacterium]|nr:ABC transporter permease [Bacteroidaceae bacterium]
MLLHNLTMAIGQLTKYKLQTLLSLVGLAVGFTCFALSSLWWRYETTYDAFHPEAENLYIQVTSLDKWATVHPVTNFGAASLAMEKIPQVEQATVFRQMPLNINESIYDNAMIADSMFLPTFQPELVVGSYPLMHPDGTMAVVTDELAIKLFGTTDCIGKEVKLAVQVDDPESYTGEMWENGTYTVAAVVKSWGKHSFFRFTCIVPFKSAEIADRTSEDYVWTYQTVLRMHPTANADTVTALGNKVQPLSLGYDSRVVPLCSFRSVFPDFYVNSVKVDHIRIFALLGLVVVICAVFNYLSLYVIRIRMRARELALRLVCGSTRRQLLMLLITEFLLILLASCFIGLLFMELTLPEFKRITHIREEDSFFFTEIGIYMLAVALGTLPLLVGVTWWMQRQSLNETLHKGMVTVQRNLFRPLSQWVQLVVGMGMVFFTSVIILQLHYLRTSTDIGFKYENRATFYTWRQPELAEEMVHYLRSHPDVKEVKVGCGNIRNSGYRHIIYNKDGSKKTELTIKKILRDEADFWGLELLEGRWIEDHEKKVAVVNESAAKHLGLTYPVDTIIPNLEYRIVGVVRNVSAKSLIVPQEPMLYIPKPKDEIKQQEQRESSFRYRPGSWPTLRDSISSRFNGDNRDWGIQGDDWHIDNIDISFNRLLHSEDTLLCLFYVMTAVCILIALFGVYSLITISCEQRRKEIAVRKVFGAKVGDILRLFFTEQLVVLLAAAVVAFPVAYACVKPWLEGYIHQVDIPLWLCPAIFAGVALLVALCIGWRVWRTAKAHPADEICKG